MIPKVEEFYFTIGDNKTKCPSSRNFEFTGATSVKLTIRARGRGCSDASSDNGAGASFDAASDHGSNANDVAHSDTGSEKLRRQFRRQLQRHL